MTDWLRPAELARTAVKAVVSGVFGAYADKREMQAALDPAPRSECTADYAGESGDFWFDFVADLGDGFDATYSVASVLAQPSLKVGSLELLRGRLLVMGGDQVYPTPTREGYTDRLKGPYDAAAVASGGSQGTEPHLYAIPGNHDWYDGLTGFLRLFCQRRKIGLWSTQQTRSYFALRLPQNWWIWGLDIQLSSDVDKPQLDYFSSVALHMDELAKERGPQHLILCTGQPSWVTCGVAKPPRHIGFAEPAHFANQAFLETGIWQREGIRLVATLSGDLHHYMRYQETQRAGIETEPDLALQRITAGGGGAYLYPTHHMPQTLELKEDEEPVCYEQAKAYPDAAISRRLAFDFFRLPFRNWRFSVLLGTIYLIFAWTLQSASSAAPINCHLAGDVTLSLELCLSHADLGLLWEQGFRWVWDTGAAYWLVLRQSPPNVVFGAVVIFGLYRFRLAEGTSQRPWLGVVHGVAHILLNFLLIWLISRVTLSHLPWHLREVRQVITFVLVMVIGGGVLGGLLFGVYLWLSSLYHGGHLNEVFSARHIADWKNFLRLKIDTDGNLTIYPIGIPRVPRHWEVRGKPPTPGVYPVEGPVPIHLIEPGVVCRQRR